MAWERRRPLDPSRSPHSALSRTPDAQPYQREDVSLDDQGPLASNFCSLAIVLLSLSLPRSTGSQYAETWLPKRLHERIRSAPGGLAGTTWMSLTPHRHATTPRCHFVGILARRAQTDDDRGGRPSCQVRQQASSRVCSETRRAVCSSLKPLFVFLLTRTATPSFTAFFCNEAVNLKTHRPLLAANQISV